MEDFDGKIIMLILFVVISAVKWFAEKIKKQGQEPHETSESLEEIYDEFREEIRNRQTKVQHPQDIFTPHHHEFGQQTPPPLPPAVEYEPEYHPEPIPEPRKVYKAKLSKREKAALANLQQRMSGTPKKKRGQRTHTTLRGMLASPRTARQAIVLHEILAKPKSMQS